MKKSIKEFFNFCKQQSPLVKEKGYLLYAKIDDTMFIPLTIYSNSVVANTKIGHLWRIMKEWHNISLHIENESKYVMLNRYSYRAAKALSTANMSDDGVDILADNVRELMKECMDDGKLSSKLNKDNDDNSFILILKEISIIE